MCVCVSVCVLLIKTFTMLQGQANSVSFSCIHVNKTKRQPIKSQGLAVPNILGCHRQSEAAEQTSEVEALAAGKRAAGLCCKHSEDKQTPLWLHQHL